jgi:Ca-activated chloride channel family protein
VVALWTGLAALAAAAVAEWIHRARVRRVAALTFGPSRKPRPWARLAPFLRPAAAGAAAWGLSMLLVLPPKVFTTEIEETDDPRHVILVLDVSPSMKLKDAGVEGNRTRTQRASELMESFFKRMHTGRIRWSVVAVHNGALPVVVDTRDLEVIRNILGDLPLHHAFDIGKTRLFEGIRQAAEVARPWKLGSAAVVIVSDGDTVPSIGMPDLPPSVADVLVIGVGDTRAGKFIDGHLSRQDALTLKQIATRLRGVYHDGNKKHLETDTLRRLASMSYRDTKDDPTRREYALAAIAFGAAVLAFLPAALASWGAGYRPGVRGDRAPVKPERPEPDAARSRKEETLHA